MSEKLVNLEKFLKFRQFKHIRTKCCWAAMESEKAPKNDDTYQIAGVHHAFLRTNPKHGLVMHKKLKAGIELVSIGRIKSVIHARERAFWNKIKTALSLGPRQLSL